MDPTTLLFLLVGFALVVFLLDLFFAGGAMTMGMMYGMAGMMSNPIGQALLLVLLAILGVLIYGVFFR